VVAEVPPAVVAVTLTAPGLPPGAAGALIVAEVPAPLTLTEVALPAAPKAKVVAPVTKLVPVQVTDSPTASLPSLGTQPLRVGVAR
jgi:hypothetical protein